MSKRRTATRRTRWQPIVGLILIGALALVAAVVWLRMRVSPARLVSGTQRAQTVEPGSPASDTGEEFSEAERRSLEEILNRHGTGK